VGFEKAKELSAVPSLQVSEFLFDTISPLGALWACASEQEEENAAVVFQSTSRLEKTCSQSVVLKA